MRRRRDEQLQVAARDQCRSEHRLSGRGDREPCQQLGARAREEQDRRADAADDSRKLSEVAVGHENEAYGRVIGKAA
jgi:hypothetical protein